MSAETLIARLDRVKRTGPGRWIARCPAHADRSPSLSIRECDDGRLLVHCFAGCPVNEVVSAVGLTISDLMPERISEHMPRAKRPFNPFDVLACIAGEALVLAVAAAHINSGEAITDTDRARVMKAAARLGAAAEMARAL